jgi:hypothetical protein
MEETMDLARRAVDHYLNRTTDQAADTYALDVSAYTDPDRYAHEVQKVFKEKPLALALSKWPNPTAIPPPKCAAHL